MKHSDTLNAPPISPNPEACWGVEKDGAVYVKWVTLNEAAALVALDDGVPKIVWLDLAERSCEAI